MKTLMEALLGPFPYFRFGMRTIAQLRAGFSKEMALRRAMDYVAVSGLNGDYLEFGVWRGRSFAAASYLAKKRRLSHGFLRVRFILRSA